MRTVGEKNVYARRRRRKKINGGFTVGDTGEKIDGDRKIVNISPLHVMVRASPKACTFRQAKKG